MLETVLRDPRILAAIPGYSLATLKAGRVDSVHVGGVRGTNDPVPVDVHTVFEAASLTKPLVSFIALQLVDEGLLDLDEPLHAVCGEYVPQDPRSQAITARHVLNHTSGLPNIVGAQTPLKTYFEPGARFSYSSSAFGWLQRALEQRAGRPLQELARARVFSACGMADSSLQWQERFEANHAQGQEMDGQPVPKRRVAQAAASWSLLTTAPDYARFVQLVLGGRGLSAGLHRQWLAPAVQAREGVDDVLNPQAAEDKGVAWGLGWGLELPQGCFFHWGKCPGFRAVVMGNVSRQEAIVWFANSGRGLRLARLVLPDILPGEHPALAWLQVGQTLEE